VAGALIARGQGDWLVERDRSVGLDHACAIETDDSVWWWGSNARGQLGGGTKTESLVPVRAQR